MPSSTSSSEVPPRQRSWLALAGLALLGATLATTAWELDCRRRGYGPATNDTPDLWAVARDAVEPLSLVIVGSSRMVFDIDLATIAKGLGSDPLQLAVVGSTPRAMLGDLAQDPSFHGTVLVGVTPPLFFAGAGPTVEKTDDWLRYRRQRSLAQRFGNAIGRPLEERLALLRSEDLSLGALLGALPLPNRASRAIPPRMPFYMGPMSRQRQMRMSHRLATDPATQGELQGIWQGLLNAAPPLPKEVVIASRDAVLEESRANVEALRARGGRVLFIRLPSTGWFREMEAERTPRAEYWDRLLAATDAPGIHFEDEPALRGWDCPEWSHLNAEDAVRFTAELTPIIRRRLSESYSE